MPRVRPPGKIDPHVLPTVMKSRDILMHMQQNINVMAINLPRYPRFHKAIKVSNIALLSFPLPSRTRAAARVALTLSGYICLKVSIAST